MTWVRLFLSWDEHAKREAAVFEHFDAVFSSAGSPEDAALFSRTTADGVEFFATGTGHSAVGRVLAANGFKASETPSAQGLGLMIGHADSRQRMLGA